MGIPVPENMISILKRSRAFCRPVLMSAGAGHLCIVYEVWPSFMQQTQTLICLCAVAMHTKIVLWSHDLSWQDDWQLDSGAGQNVAEHIYPCQGDLGRWFISRHGFKYVAKWCFYQARILVSWNTDGTGYQYLTFKASFDWEMYPFSINRKYMFVIWDIRLIYISMILHSFNLTWLLCWEAISLEDMCLKWPGIQMIVYILYLIVTKLLPEPMLTCPLWLQLSRW